MIRVWLAAFVVLFAAVELFEWFAQLGSWQPTGMWLVLGGIGLAALSNATHLSKMSAANPAVPQTAAGAQTETAQTETTGSDQPVAQVAATTQEKIEDQVAECVDKDSISFKVRPLKR